MSEDTRLASIAPRENLTNAVVMCLPEVLEAPRFLLRCPRVGEGAEVNNAIRENFEALNRWLPWAREVASVEDTEGFTAQAQEKFQKGEEFVFQIRDKESQFLYGYIGLHINNREVPSFEIGYWSRKEAQGKGYMTEAALFLTAVGFEVLKANRMIIRCDALNDKSHGVIERCGYLYEGASRNWFRDNRGELAMLLTYSLTPEDYEKLKAEGKFDSFTLPK